MTMHAVQTSVGEWIPIKLLIVLLYIFLFVSLVFEAFEALGYKKRQSFTCVQSGVTKPQLLHNYVFNTYDSFDCLVSMNQIKISLSTCMKLIFWNL